MYCYHGILFILEESNEEKKYVKICELNHEGRILSMCEMKNGYIFTGGTGLNGKKNNHIYIWKPEEGKGYVHSQTLSGHKSDIINKNDFKYFLAKQAILLNDNDIDSIFAVYDISKSDYINYIMFLNSINRVNETRKAQIESFKDQVKVPGQNYIYFSNLISLANMNYHPEAIKFLKTVPDLLEEYSIYIIII